MLKRKHDLGNCFISAGMEEVNGEKCEGQGGEVESKNSLRWYKKTKDDGGTERYRWSVQGQKGEVDVQVEDRVGRSAPG